MRRLSRVGEARQLMPEGDHPELSFDPLDDAQPLHIAQGPHALGPHRSRGGISGPQAGSSSAAVAPRPIKNAA